MQNYIGNQIKPLDRKFPFCKCGIYLPAFDKILPVTACAAAAEITAAAETSPAAAR